MDERIGSIIVFKEGVTTGEAAAILLNLKDKIELKMVPGSDNVHVAARNMVRKFNPEYGGPVWYIP